MNLLVSTFVFVGISVVVALFIITCTVNASSNKRYKNKRAFNAMAGNKKIKGAI